MDSAASLSTTSGTISGAGGSKRQRGPHRAVVAAQQAAIHDPLRGASPIISTEKPYRCLAHSRPVVKYASFDELVKERLRTDPFIEKRAELESMQEKPTPKNELDAVSDTLLLKIFSFLGFATRDGVVLSSTCRRLRALALSQCCLRDVHIVPDMLSMEAYSLKDVPDESQWCQRLRSLAHFHNMHKRGQHVHSLALLESKYASTLPLSATFPTASIAHTLSLVAELPWLTVLDVRSVNWSAGSASKITYFLSDLHLVAPQLTTLKMGVDLYLSWTPGWWQHHSELSSVVVASRREQPPPQLDVPPPTIPLHSDLLVMLQAERQWKLKIWAAMEESSLRRLLFPPTALHSLTELTVNVIGCSPLSVPTDPMELSDAKKGKNNKRPVSPMDGEALAFPRLTSLTIANVDENPMLGVELYAKVCAQAPRLSFFSICNTVKYPPPERLKGRRRLAAAANKS